MQEDRAPRGEEDFILDRAADDMSVGTDKAIGSDGQRLSSEVWRTAFSMMMHSRPILMEPPSATT